MRYTIQDGKATDVQVLASPTASVTDPSAFAPLDPAATYLVATTDFQARIAPGYSDLFKQAASVTETGIVVNERPGVPRQIVRRLRAILHRARTEGLAAQNREKRPDFEGWLRGMIAYVAMVNPKQAEPLRKALAALPGA